MLRIEFLAIGLGLATGCATVQPHPENEHHGTRSMRADVLPPATEALEIKALEGATLAAWIDELARLTGQRIVITESATRAAEAIPELRGPTTPIPRDEVYPFVEGILVANDLYFANASTDEHPLLAVYGLQGRAQPWGHLSQDDRHVLRQHPALMVAMVVELPSTDARQTSSALRGLLTDTNTQALLATGPHTVIVRGMGHYVDGVASILLDTEASNARAMAARAQLTPQASEGSKTE